MVAGSRYASSPTSRLTALLSGPATLTDEHQKYIHDVLPRMVAEVEAGNWGTFDEYTDRLLQYQRTFSATTPIRQAGGSTTLILISVLFLLFLSSPYLVSENFMLKPKS